MSILFTFFNCTTKNNEKNDIFVKIEIKYSVGYLTGFNNHILANKYPIYLIRHFIGYEN